MSKHRYLVALAFAAMASAAQASMVNIKYDGVITEVLDPTASFGFHTGDVIYYSVTFDPSRLVDVSQTFFNIDFITGLPVSIPGLRTASLSDDPRASVSVQIGSYAFTKFDALGYGQDFGLGVGNFPVVVFDGTTFLGAVLDAGAPNGFELDSDPIARLLHYFPDDVLSFDDNSGNAGFVASTDIAHAVTTAVPEPASWLMMIVGFGIVGCFSRRPGHVELPKRVARLG